MRSGSIPRLRAGETDAAIRFEFDEAGTMSLAIKGPFVDVSGALGGEPETQDGQGGGKPPPDGPPMKISIATPKMRTHPGKMVEQVNLLLHLGRMGEINRLEMDARAGTGGLHVRLRPDAQGKTTLRIEAGDAGAALRAFNIYETMQGGTLTVTGQPMNPSLRGAGDISGTGRIDNFKVVDAPVLAQLLSAMSLPGLLQLLGNDGVNFTRLEAQFDWLWRPKGSMYVLRDGRTSGNALGLTFEGVVDSAAGTSDLSGTIVPISDINRLIGNIPLVGDILAGGAGGAVFAATYTIKGPSKTPRVTVNPLAALTPGILRKILFE